MEFPLECSFNSFSAHKKQLNEAEEEEGMGAPTCTNVQRLVLNSPYKFP